MVMTGNTISTITGNGSRRREPELVDQDDAQAPRRDHATVSDAGGRRPGPGWRGHIGGR